MTPDQARRPGRQRDPACDRAILDAARSAFVELGFRGMSMEGVAARAGVGKATVYRRYSTKAQLLVAAVRHRLCLPDHLPASGDLRADLVEMLQPLVERLRGPDGPFLVAFMTERFREPELAGEFDRSVVGAKRVHLRRLVQDAVDRGDLGPDTDVELLAETGPAIIWHHALGGHPLPADLVERIVDQMLGARPRTTRR